LIPKAYSAVPFFKLPLGTRGTAPLGGRTRTGPDPEIGEIYNRRDAGKKEEPDMAGAFDIGCEIHKALTTPDSTDWTVIFDRDAVHVSTMAEAPVGDDKIEVTRCYGVVPLAEFRCMLENLPPTYKLGCVTAHVCKDSEAIGVLPQLEWIRGQAKRHRCGFMLMVGCTTTVEAAELMASYDMEAAMEWFSGQGGLNV
jgi:hypothetical protein